MNGFLIIDKPAGPTSHDVVARVRRALGTPRIGHTGTLDPLATGVLPLVVGQATRVASMLSVADKDYAAAVRLGRATDTYDAAHLEGPPPAPPAGIDAAAIDAALEGFRGTYPQMPPPFSAKKIGGVAAYKLARRNQPVELRPVPVTVTRLALVSYEDGLARLEVTCGSGFYVRSLAHELGVRLGCGAYLEALRRTRVGIFAAADSVALATVEAEARHAAARLVPLERGLPGVPRVVLNERGVRRARHGSGLSAEDLDGQLPDLAEDASSGTGRRWLLLDAAGALLGIAEPAPGGLLHPVIVLV
jgi:tRNA pseudouridine55 synthase